MTPIVVYRHGSFGDRLLAAQLVSIARDHGINAVWWDGDPAVLSLCDVPRVDRWIPGIHWWFHYDDEHAWDGRAIMRKALDHFCADFRLPRMQITRQRIPVAYHDDPDIAGADVAICSKAGWWSAYREYPHMPELKDELDRRGVRWVDLSERNITGNAALNWAKKSIVYLGVETGMSHYVASVVGSGIVIQSGYSPAEYWSSGYGYTTLSREVSCSPCFKRDGCPHDHRCMTEIKPERIADAIEARMAR